MSQQELRGDASLLVDYAKRLARHAEGRHAVYLHLSALHPHNRLDHHIRIALNCFDPLILKFMGEIFLLENNDIVFVCKGATVSKIDDVVVKLRFLFSEDPLTWADDDAEQQVFCTWYDIETDYDGFMSMAERALDMSRKDTSALWSGDVGARAPKALQPLDPQKLGQLEQSIATLDLGGLLRRQPICVITAGRQPTPVFSEVYVSVAELQRALMPDVDLAADRWLFQRLTSVLDRRLLAFLPGHDATNDLPTSLNINVSTLLSPEFLTFDTKIRQKTKKAFIFELQAIDVYGDMAAYIFARDFLHERRYRICLDGLNSLTFPLINREHLGLDMEKIYWSPDMVNEVQHARRDHLAESVALAGPSRVILCRCDNEDAIDFGRSLGITMFQGRHIDALMRGSAFKAAS